MKEAIYHEYLHYCVQLKNQLPVCKLYEELQLGDNSWSIMQKRAGTIFSQCLTKFLNWLFPPEFPECSLWMCDENRNFDFIMAVRFLTVNKALLIDWYLLAADPLLIALDFSTLYEVLSSLNSYVKLAEEQLLCALSLPELR